MTIKSILKIAGLFLNKNDMISALDLENISSASQSVQDEINFLVKCLNLAYQEVASDYIPLLYKEKVTLTDGKLNFSGLTKTIVDVVSLKDKNGFRVKYQSFPSYLQTNENEVEITYKYQPEDLTSLSSTIESFAGRVSEKLLAFGTLMEYCFILGLYEDAEIWEKRFKDSLKLRARKKSGLKLPSRRWIWCFIKKNYY